MSHLRSSTLFHAPRLSIVILRFSSAWWSASLYRTLSAEQFAKPPPPPTAELYSTETRGKPMSSGKRDVIFFGSIAACVLGQDWKAAPGAADLQKHDVSLTLRLTATAPSLRVEEVLGAVATSGAYRPAGSIPATQAESIAAASTWKPHGAYLPVMLELAQDAAADGIALAGAAGDAQESEDEAKAEPGLSEVTVSVSMAIQCGGRNGLSTTCPPTRVTLPSLNDSATNDTVSLVRLDLTAAQLQGRDTGAGDVAVSVYVMLRIIDLSEKVSAAEESADSLRTLLNLMQPLPKLCLTLTARVQAPYGAMPLRELYRHYCLFYGRYYSRVLKSSEDVLAILTAGDALRAAEASYPHRWNALTQVNLERVLLGEEAFTPLLLSLAHCTNLSVLHADRNQVGDITCARMSALFAHHRYLRDISLCHNIIYEGGAEQILRLVRRNHRLTRVNLEKNWCTASVCNRITGVVSANGAAILQNPLNVFSAQYAYLRCPGDIPTATLKQALGVWAMLSAAPLGDVDVWVHNSTTADMEQYADDSLKPRRDVAHRTAATRPSIIPPGARAPLLNEIMRTVYTGVASAVPDPLVRSVFGDVVDGSQLREKIKASTCKEDNDCEDAQNVSASSSSRILLHAKLPRRIVRALEYRNGNHGSGDAEESEEDTIYSTSFLKIVVTTMRALASGSPWEEAAAVLRGLGRQQREMGVEPEDYWLAVNIFMKSLNVSLGCEAFTSERLAAFLMVLAIGVRTAVSVDERLEALSTKGLV